MKVTILMEPEESNEGDFGHTTMVMKEDVVLIDHLVDLYLSAAQGAGWNVDKVGAVSDNGREFWGNF